ncbi:hypothetical protein GUITHDRAFT_153287 [Guillardia theta CCMP2712]|uniref:Uncharacterized protein n=1 Tax=Guillardia theta (strain CCMP2712) TaxID=905079 RepID=L1J4S3_GUITC|nr:hypothetical protein GUITHDRAFT_153287 [Guillardia theta CCMP2712]EKX43511.1 hypothetical protein GUITHDRAFT_153287 [Guillardia theta CCMP2712]|eukprot:XP_005830491.1 hypothetical protein GUITHDRAFT_153287 [Guillardia theta CCMP2712]
MGFSPHPGFPPGVTGTPTRVAALRQQGSIAPGSPRTMSPVPSGSNPGTPRMIPQASPSDVAQTPRAELSVFCSLPSGLSEEVDKLEIQLRMARNELKELQVSHKSRL